MILRNSHGEVVYNSSYDGKPQMQFSTINDDPRLNFQTHELSYPSSEVARPVAQADYIEMKLDEKIVRDYALTERTLGTNNLQSNEETFSFGYPARTNMFSNGIGDAPGRALVAANGRAQDPFVDYSFLQTTNFGTPGASGGPTITASGELVGVNCRTTADANPSNVRTYSTPIGSNTARNYWRTIPYPSDAQLAAIDSSQTTAVNQ